MSSAQFWFELAGWWNVRVLGCGDRNWTDQSLVDSTLDAIHHDTPVEVMIEGEARGADTMCKEWAHRHKVAVEGYAADWNRYGRAAGPIRNRLQFERGRPALVVAFHDDLANSKGTKDMVSVAERAGCPVKVVSHGRTGSI